MTGVLVDSNVILDLFLDDPIWASWSESKLDTLSQTSALYINPIIYTEISVGFKRIEEVENAVSLAGFQMLQMSREVLFLTGKTFLKYRKNQGTKRSPLPDFYIGAHAAVLGIDLITRDTARYTSYFPTVKLITP